MIRGLLCLLGIRVHKGWTAIHESGWTIRCTGCGEERQAYHRSWDRARHWWETTRDGDGSCGPIKPLPTRHY